jgi:hypothetical protein
MTTALTNGRNKTISAIKYFLNSGGYDVQFISGVFHKGFTSGFGWAGSLGNVGYRGEGQYFHLKDSGDYINLSMEADYFFENGWYINGAFLYNHKGLKAPVDDWSEVNFKISPTNLMPAKWNILLGYAKEFTPLFSGNMDVIYSPGADIFIIYPSLKYNLASNVDADLVWQSFFAEMNNRFRGISHAVFLRVKWSF